MEKEKGKVGKGKNEMGRNERKRLPEVQKRERRKFGARCGVSAVKRIGGVPWVKETSNEGRPRAEGESGISELVETNSGRDGSKRYEATRGPSVYIQRERKRERGQGGRGREKNPLLAHRWIGVSVRVADEWGRVSGGGKEGDRGNRRDSKTRVKEE